MPGYTHLQRAQPVTVGHHLLAWVEMLERDPRSLLGRGRFGGGSPLGAAALAGSTLAIPPPDRQLRNSLDAVSDRDFALDLPLCLRIAPLAPIVVLREELVI